MQSNRHITALWITLAAIALISVYSCSQILRERNNVTARNASAFDRVMASSELRVGYFIEPPYLAKDTATGRLSGIFYDVTETLGKNLGLRIVWVEEANLSTISAGLDAGRYDMIAFPLWRSAARAKVVVFSAPIFYTPVGTYVREGDFRFDKGLSAINDPAIKIAGIDGELAVSIAERDFPKATIAALPNLTDYSQMLLEVASRKADVTFFTRVQAQRYMRQNPNTIREVPTAAPIRIFAECLILPMGDPRLKEMIDSSLLEMVENGVIESIFQSHGEVINDYLFPAVPYKIIK